MALQTIVEDYVFAAMRRANGARAENGALVLTVPDFPGIVACAADVPSCYRALYELLDGWVLRSLARGYRLPILDTPGGPIDLNSAASRALAAYHQRGEEIEESLSEKVLEGPEQLEEAFERFRR